MDTSHLFTAVKAFVILIAVLYAFLAQPLIVLNEFRVNKGITYKPLWFIGILILGPFVSVPFGMFFSDKRWLKRASQIAAIFLIGLIFLYVKYGETLGLTV